MVYSNQHCAIPVCVYTLARYHPGRFSVRAHLCVRHTRSERVSKSSMFLFSGEIRCFSVILALEIQQTFHWSLFKTNVTSFVLKNSPVYDP